MLLLEAAPEGLEGERKVWWQLVGEVGSGAVGRCEEAGGVWWRCRGLVLHVRECLWCQIVEEVTKIVLCEMSLPADADVDASGRMVRVAQVAFADVVVAVWPVEKLAGFDVDCEGRVQIGLIV
jgi:hypothetical protein